MAFVRIQGNGTANSARAGTIALTQSAVRNGDFVCGSVSYDFNTLGGTTLSGIADDKSNSYFTSTEARDATNGQATLVFWRTNITNGPATITASFSGPGADARSIIWDEFSGGSTASTNENNGSNSNFQTTPGTGANAVTTGAVVTTVNGCLIYCVSGDTSSGAAHTVTAGTVPAFVLTGSDSGNVAFTSRLQSETLTQSSAASITGTFTQANNDNRNSAIVAIKPGGQIFVPRAPLLNVGWTPLFGIGTMLIRNKPVTRRGIILPK